MEVLPTANFQPDIVVAGIRLGEPVIALTGLLVAVVCFYAWFRLGKTPVTDDTTRLFRIFFLLMGISTVIGAVVGHVFLYCLPFVYKTPGWGLGMVAVSALEQAAIVRARPYLKPFWGKALTWANIVELTLALWFVSSTLWFPAVEMHSAFGLLCVVAPLELWYYRKTGSKESRYLWAGILFLVAGVLFHVLKLSLGVWFCYFDIAHLLMCPAFWCFMLWAEAQLPAPDFVSIG